VTQPMDPVANGSPTVRASVSIGMGAGTPLPPAINSRLLRVVVDNDAHLPGMFELTFLDLDGSTLPTARITIGSQITISGTPTAGGGSTRTSSTSAGGPLIVGEVTAIEGLMQGMTAQTVVRGYTSAHRLQRTKKSRTFLNSTDSDIARQIATQAGLRVGTIMPTRTTHAYVPQVNQTDWEFLTARATEIGYEIGVQAGLFYFRSSSGGPAARGGAGGGVRGAASGAARGGAGVSVKFPDTLISFRPRVTAGNLTPDVEVRVWDPMERRALAQIAATPAGPSPSPATLGGQFTGGALSGVTGGLSSAAGALSSGNVAGAASGVSSAASGASAGVSSMTGGLLGSPIGYLGPPPSPTAHVVSDRPMANGYTMATAGPLGAAALGSDLGSTYAEAEGDAVGNPGIQPGVMITVTGVPAPFAGGWKVSRARHIFDDSEHGYRTTFAAHGRQDRSMLGLTSKSGRGPSGSSTLDGVVCGVVSNCADPLQKGRVKVTLPWLSPMFETDWAPNVQFCSGQRTGAMFMPEVGDEVLVAFEFGDPRRPYVLGGMMNNYTKWSVAASGPIMAGGGGASPDTFGSVMDSMGAAGKVVSALSKAENPEAMGAGLISSTGMAGSIAVSASGMGSGSSPGSGSSSSGAIMTPGMVSEIRHRGFVSTTGNCLLFYDQPMPVVGGLTSGSATSGAAPTGMSGSGGSGGASGGSGGASSGAGGTGGSSGGAAGAGAMGGAGGLMPISSAVRLGNQDGRMGLTIDQANAGINLMCNMIPGVSKFPIPMMNIVSENGQINISSGPAGVMMIDGGSTLMIKSTAAITVQAPTINLNGAAFANGLPII